MRKGLRVLLLLTALALGVYAIARDTEGFLAAIAEVGVSRTGGALVLVTLGLLASAETWRSSIAAIAGKMDRRSAHRIFFVTQLGKYLPGAVWTVLGQVEAAKRHALSGSRMGIGALLFLVIHVVTGLVVAAVLLPWSSPHALGAFGWSIPLAPLLACLLVPRVLTRIVSVVLRLLHRPGLPGPLSWRDVAVPLAWMLLTWSLYGLALAAVAQPLAGDAPIQLIAVVGIGIFALGWVVGVLVIPAPAGLGAREVTLFIGLGPLVGATGATSIAIILRVIHTLADLLLAAGAARPRRRSRSDGRTSDVD